MAGISDWFHVSKEEQERRRVEMTKRVFRFGDAAQRPVVAKVLDELYGDTRHFSAQDQIYGYISARDAYALAYEKNPADEDAAVAAAVKQLSRIGWRDKERIRLMLALLDLDEKTTTLEDYPTADAVRAHAGAIRAI